MSNATPTLITCPNPSITPKRPQPRDRSTALPAKKRKLVTPEAGSEASDDVHPMEELPPLPPPPLDMSKNFKEHDRLAQVLTDLITLRSQYQAQSQKLNRLQERLEEKLEVELELQKERERVKNLRRLHLQLF
ncbi:hypothetical protein CAPTEDRAFT_215130 [Capitella teleta]|uniref:Uncharacterized protein n=1 Tax=Capitella teleta TaxID=283909 RepID=R7V6K7_CAPTE|nr:hypothetical protein CAPTEDRAFT_215130 [Capitella teleta]|eukprot:ELU12001.1 hypothetical protein CAPTEDRAFT_215130 [Capitella teleta]